MAGAVHGSEKQFQQSIIDLARLSGWRCYHTLRSTGSTSAGYDVLIFAELKTDVGRVTPVQAAWLAALGAVTTVHAGVWRPTDWDGIEQRLLSR